MNSLIFSNEKCFEILKQYEESKIKAYVCVACSSKTISEDDIAKINSIENLIVDFFFLWVKNFKFIT